MFVMFLCIIWSHNLPKKAGRIFPNLDYINKNTTVFWRWEFIFTTVKLRFIEVSLYSYCQNFFSRLRHGELDENNCFRFSIDGAAAATILYLYNQAGKFYQKRHPKNFFKNFFGSLQAGLYRQNTTVKIRTFLQITIVFLANEIASGWG